MFTYPRYLDDQNDGQKTGLTLEQLYQLAKKRSKERKKGREVAGDVEKEASIEMGHLKIDGKDERGQKEKEEESSPKRKKRKKEQQLESEGMSAKKKLKKKREEESNGEECVEETMPRTEENMQEWNENMAERSKEDNQYQEEEMVVEEEEMLEPGEDEEHGDKTEECSDSDRDEQDLGGGDDCEETPSGDQLVPLLPAALAQSGSRGVSGGVDRQLPSWITSPRVVETDIASCSRPVQHFPAIPQLLVRNLSNTGVDRFFPVQVHVIPYLMGYIHGPLCTGPGGATPPDVFVCAPTGCGKTMCYALPIVTALLNRVLQQVRALVVVPSQELACQVLAVFEQLTHGTGLSVARISGHLPLELECTLLRDSSSYPVGSKVDILIATPGRLVEHLERRSFASLAFLRFLVIDEADKILDYHFNQWLPKLLQALSASKATPPGSKPRAELLGESLLSQCSSHEVFRLMRRACSSFSNGKATPPLSMSIQDGQLQTSPVQKLLFSASMTLSPEQLAKLRLHRPVLFTTQPVQSSRGLSGGSRDLMLTLPLQLTEKIMKCDLELKPLALLHLIGGRIDGCGQEQEMERVLVFANSRDSTHRLCVLLKMFDQFPVSEMSASVSLPQRQVILKDFRSGRGKVLVCSDQMARGIDIEGVTCIINYEPPRQYRVYLHRAGRTARAGKEGVVYTLVAKDEVHPFKVMLRKSVGSKSLEEVKVASNDLQDYLCQYQECLEKLRQQLK